MKKGKMTEEIPKESEEDYGFPENYLQDVESYRKYLSERTYYSTDKMVEDIEELLEERDTK